MDVIAKILLLALTYTGQPNLTFFCALNETNKSLLILGRWIRIRYWFFSITSEFCSIASFMVARSINQFFAFCEKTKRDIENLNTYRRFKIKFCAFKKKDIENRISRSWDIGHLSWRNSKKRHFSTIFFCFLNFFLN